MLALIADLSLCPVMSVSPYVLAPSCTCTLMSAPLCPSPLCRVSGPEVGTFKTKTFDFTLVLRFNRLEKIELRGCAGPPGRRSYLLIIAVVRVYCCTPRC